MDAFILPTSLGFISWLLSLSNWSWRCFMHVDESFWIHISHRTNHLCLTGNLCFSLMKFGKFHWQSHVFFYWLLPYSGKIQHQLLKAVHVTHAKIIPEPTLIIYSMFTKCWPKFCWKCTVLFFSPTILYNHFWSCLYRCLFLTVENTLIFSGEVFSIKILTGLYLMLQT